MSDTTSKELKLYELDPKQQRFIQLYLTGNFSLTKIAELLEIHPNTAGRWMKSPAIKSALEEAQHEIFEQVSYELKGMSIKAVKKLGDLIDSPMDAIALQAVRDVLDRGGHKPKNEIKIDKTVTTIEEKMKQIIDMTIPDAIVEEVVEDE